MKSVDDAIELYVDPKQFGGLSSTSTTDALVEMTHTWYEATDILNNCVQVVLLDFSKAFDAINHLVLLEKLRLFGISPYIVRWLAAFLLDRTQKVRIVLYSKYANSVVRRLYKNRLILLLYN